MSVNQLVTFSSEAAVWKAPRAHTAAVKLPISSNPKASDPLGRDPDCLKIAIASQLLAQV